MWSGGSLALPSLHTILCVCVCVCVCVCMCVCASVYVCRSEMIDRSWLRTINCFIWDEVSMAHKWALDAVERLLRDIRENDAPFGGVTMLFSGDMQQLLPVHRFARDPAAYCFKTCAWYGCNHPLQLTQNVRYLASNVLLLFDTLTPPQGSQRSSLGSICCGYWQRSACCFPCILRGGER